MTGEVKSFPLRVASASLLAISPELVAELRAKKLIKLPEETEIELNSVAGSPVVGTLTASEAAVFREIVYLSDEMLQWAHEIDARQHESYVDAVRASRSTQEVNERLQEAAIITDEEAEDYFSTIDILAYLTGLFWVTLRLRLRSHTKILAIRAGYKVCECGLKYKRKG